MRKLIIFLLAVWGLSGSLKGASGELRLSADECRDMAIENSLRLKQADVAIRQAELDRRVADIARLPNVAGSVMGMYTFPDIDMMGMKLQMRGAYMAGLQLTQPIYAGGKITAGRRLAKIGERVVAEQMRMERIDVVADALEAYWTYLAVLDKVALARRYHAMVDTIYSQTEVAVEVGMATENDLLRIAAKRSELVYQEKKATNGAELCRLALCNAIGVDFSTHIILTDSVPAVKEPGRLAVDVSGRPEIAMLGLQVEAKRHQVKLTLGDYLPTIGLSIGYNWYGNIKMKGYADVGDGMMVPYTSKFQDNLGMAMLAIQIPLFHWGEGAKKVRNAKLGVEAAMLDFEDKSQLLELEARQAAMNVEDGWALIESARVALEQAEENLRVMQDRYSESMASLTDLLDAQNQWHRSRSDMTEAMTQYQIYRIAWLRSIGEL